MNRDQDPRDLLAVELEPHLGSVSVLWLEPDTKAGLIRFGLSDGRTGKAMAGSDGWGNATVYVSGS